MSKELRAARAVELRHRQEKRRRSLAEDSEEEEYDVDPAPLPKASSWLPEIPAAGTGMYPCHALVDL